MVKRMVLVLCILGVAAIGFAGPAQADDTAATGVTKKTQRSGLGVRHQRVERMMEDLERKFTKLAQALQEAEPERADRLIETQLGD